MPWLLSDRGGFTEEMQDAIPRPRRDTKTQLSFNVGMRADAIFTLFPLSGNDHTEWYRFGKHRAMCRRRADRRGLQCDARVWLGCKVLQ